MIRRDDAHARRTFAPKNKPRHDPEAISTFAREHWYCQCCGKYGDFGVYGTLTIHHIIGGRGGRSDEPCNLFAACWIPCHSQFADMTVNLPIVLTMKLRAGEMTVEDVERLETLNGCNLPDLAPIPEEMMIQFERNRPEVMAVSQYAQIVHAWSRFPDHSIRPTR